MREFTIAAVQACPAFMDLDASVEKACSLIAEAGAAGAALAVFPECFLPGYPLWVWFIPPGHTHPLRELFSLLHANSVAVPGPAVDRLCAAARAANVTVVMGINERNEEASGSTLFNSILFIGADGELLGKHRKLVPTGGERLVHGRGDGSGLRVHDTPFGKLSGLICWENYMPLARYALGSWGTQVHAAPTWDRGEPWLSTLRHVAKECRCFVVGCGSPMRKDDLPDSLAFKAKYLGDVEGWLNPGDSMIVDPDGKVLAGPAGEEETILYALVRAEQLTGPRWQLDIAGHYARPDIFRLQVDRSARPMIDETDGEAGELAGEE